jgi:enoyl-CoA hydratase/carnithine racemase
MTHVHLRIESDHVAVVTLARPEALNAISGAMADELAGAVLQAAAQPETWVVVLAAEGEKAFCAGADLKERNRLDDAGWLRNRIAMRALFDSVRAVPQPTIASVFGAALGGGFELALSCDLVVAADDAVFGLPETGVGIVPGGGGNAAVAQGGGDSNGEGAHLHQAPVVGGRSAGARLATRVVPRADLETATMALAEEICRSSPVAVREAKRAVDLALGTPLDVGLDLEDLAWRRAVASEDRVEGIAAFNDKRDPRWRNR